MRPSMPAGNASPSICRPEVIYIDGDIVRLSQVISNLLNNAAKYTDEGGEITLTARDNGDQVAIAVRGTGIGIRSDVLPHVFDLFMQADQSLARSLGGLGIGLTLVRQLVETHGGGAWVRIAKGRARAANSPSGCPQCDDRAPMCHPPKSKKYAARSAAAS